MNVKNLQPNSAGPVSRRNLLGGAAALAAAGASSRLAQSQGPSKKGTILAYIGTYTPNGQGIHRFQVDLTTGALTNLKAFASVNPSWIAFDPTYRFLFAVNEISNYNGTTTGSVTSYRVDPATGDLTLINVVTSGGAGPAHLSVHPSGKWVFVANYGGGNVAVLPVDASGHLSAPSDIQADANTCVPGPCALGPTHAVKAPPGSFAVSGHDAPHAHMIQSDPSGNYVVANDLGLDRTIVWKLDKTLGKLTDPKTVSSSPGAGPRHFVFHPSGRLFYSINEEASTLSFMTYDASTGTLTPVSEISTLPPAFVGTNFTSELIVSSDGRFLYGLNRLHDTVAIFAIDGVGMPTLIGEEWTRGDYPRSCGIDPTGNFLYVCNHRGDSVVTFRIDGGGRRLTFTDRYTAVGSPAVITFLVL
jgi:6-phosphogluconolactonase